jgi:hypothetical protein
MFELAGIVSVFAACLYQRFDLAAFIMSIVVYAKLWMMTKDINRILNNKEETE